MKTNWILATVTGIFLLLFILIYVCLDKKNARECLQNEQKGITTVRLLPLFYRIMLGCTALLSVVYMILVLFPNESVTVFVYSFFGAFTLFCATVTIMMRLWKIEFDEGIDYFHYRSSYGIKHKIYYKDITEYKIGTSTVTLKTQKRTYYIEMFSLNIELFLKQIKIHHVPKQQNNIVRFKTSHKAVYLLTSILWVGLTVFVGGLSTENAEKGVVYVFIALTFIIIYMTLRAFFWKIKIYNGLSFFEYKGVFTKTRVVYYKDCTAKEILRDYILLKHSRGYIIIGKNMENIDRLQKAFRENRVKVNKK